MKTKPIAISTKYKGTRIHIYCSPECFAAIYGEIMFAKDAKAMFNGRLESDTDPRCKATRNLVYTELAAFVGQMKQQYSGTAQPSDRPTA